MELLKKYGDEVIEYFYNNEENGSPTIAKKFNLKVNQVNYILNHHFKKKKI